MTEYLSLAQSLIQKGFAIFPCHGIKEVSVMGEKILTCTCGAVPCTSPGKHPAIQKGRNAATKDMAVFENLAAGRHGLNIAIATGIESGCFVLDVDGIQGMETLAGLEAEHGKLPKTLTCITSRGKHFFFKYPNRKVFNRTHVWPNCDIRGDGGYVISSGSKHISGHVYKWEDDSTGIANAPD